MKVSFVILSQSTADNLLWNGDFERIVNAKCNFNTFLDIDRITEYCYTPYGANFSKYPIAGMPICTYDPDFKSCNGSDEISISPHSGRLMMELRSNVIKAPKHGEGKEHWYTDHIAFELRKPLQIGKIYVVSFFIAHSKRFNYTSSGWGWTLTAQFPSSYDGAQYLHQVLKPDFMLDTAVSITPHKWTQIQVAVQAKNKANYLLFGNFSDPQSIKIGRSPLLLLKDTISADKAFDTAYYVDDFVVRPASFAETTDYFIEKKGEFRLGSIYFETASDSLQARGKNMLRAMATEIDKLPKEYGIQLTGWADMEGDAESNKALSERRAAHVQEFLSSLLKNKRNFKVVGEGATIIEGKSSERKVAIGLVKE